MKRQLKTVNEITKITGIAIRALHYDEMNLLKPVEISQAVYGLYSNEDVETSQQIMLS